MTFRLEPVGRALFVVSTAVLMFAGCAGTAPATAPPATQPPSAAAASTTAPSTSSATVAPAAQTPAASSDGVETMLVQLSGVGPIAASDSQVWVALNSGDVDAIDMATKQVHPVAVHGSALNGISVGASAVWVADFAGGALIKIDPKTYQVVDRVAVPDAADALEVNGTVWVTNHEEGTVTLVDAATDKVQKTVTVGDAGANGPQNIAFGLGSVWVDEKNTNNVIRLDPTTDKIVAKINAPLVHPCGDIATTSQAVWVTGCGDTNAVARIDPQANNTTASTTLPSSAETPVVIDDSVWLPLTNEVAHLDPATGKVDKQVDVPELGAGGPSVVSGETLYVSDNVATVKAVPLSLLTGTSP